MARVFSHQWSDKKPFTRRVRWYCEPWEPHGPRDKNIRLQFDDSHGKANRNYGNHKDLADRDWNAFTEGKLTTLQILNGEAPSEFEEVDCPFCGVVKVRPDITVYVSSIQMVVPTSGFCPLCQHRLIWADSSGKPYDKVKRVDRN